MKPLVLALVSSAAISCTAAQLQGVEASLAAFAAATPAACAVVSAIDGSAAGKVCSTDTAGAAALAADLTDIIKTLPPSPTLTAKGASAAAPPMQAYESNGMHVEIRMDICAQVQAAAAAQAKKITK